MDPFKIHERWPEYENRGRHVGLEGLLNGDLVTISERHRRHGEADRHQTAGETGVHANHLIGDDIDNSHGRSVPGSRYLPRPRAFLQIIDLCLSVGIGFQGVFLLQNRVLDSDRRIWHRFHKNVIHAELHLALLG